MEPEFALRMERRLRFSNTSAEIASMEPEFALRMEPGQRGGGDDNNGLQWSRSLHSGWNEGIPERDRLSVCFNGAGVCTPDGTVPSK